jgi:acetyltransferase-like isoleucine patch superfamily enzyme
MLRKLFRVVTQPIHAVESARYWLYLCKIQRFGNVRIHPSIWFRGLPLIDISKGASLEIAAGAQLDSRNRGYHLKMYGPVKLMADRDGAQIKIGEGTRIHGSCLHAVSAILIGRRCLIAANCQIADNHGHDVCLANPANRIHTSGPAMPITVEDNVWIGAGTVIMPGVTIGEGSVIGANSVVTKNVPARVVAAGAPARVVKTA